MTAIRFDKDQNDTADENPELTAEWGSYEDAIWYLTDDQSNGRWLFVDHHSPYHGGIPLGIGRGVYTKYLSPEAAESLADALRVAAAEAREIEAERQRVEEEQRLARERCVTEFGGHDWPTSRGDFYSMAVGLCTRCGATPAMMFTTSNTSFRTVIS